MTRLPRLALPTLLALAIFALACGPIGPIPGGRLSGPVENAPADWGFASDVGTIQLETRPDDPHSVNTWCGVVDGALYVPTSLIRGTDEPSEREWVANALADPRVRIRVGDSVYQARAVRVDDPTEREAARAALIAKYDVEPDPHSEAAWVFRMEAR